MHLEQTLYWQSVFALLILYANLCINAKEINTNKVNHWFCKEQMFSKKTQLAFRQETAMENCLVHVPIVIAVLFVSRVYQSIYFVRSNTGG